MKFSICEVHTNDDTHTSDFKGCSDLVLKEKIYIDLFDWMKYKSIVIN